MHPSVSPGWTHLSIKRSSKSQKRQENNIKHKKQNKSNAPGRQRMLPPRGRRERDQVNPYPPFASRTKIALFGRHLLCNRRIKLRDDFTPSNIMGSSSRGRELTKSHTPEARARLSHLVASPHAVMCKAGQTQAKPGRAKPSHSRTKPSQATPLHAKPSQTSSDASPAQLSRPSSQRLFPPSRAVQKLISFSLRR